MIIDIILSVLVGLLVMNAYIGHIKFKILARVLKETRQSLNETRAEVQKLNKFKKEATKILERL